LLLQNQQMLSQKQKFNADQNNNNNKKPQYTTILGQQVPKKSNQPSPDLKGLENNKDLQDISCITANVNRGNPSY